MLKLLIIDDEPDICELIHKLVAWEELGLMSLGSAQNGLDALEIILRQKPDIVITDLRIPGMTGLELIEKVHSMKLPVSFIVISGYREFEYAQQAIRFGVEEYLLKPVNKTDLNLVLERLIVKKDTIRQQQGRLEVMRKDIIQKNHVLRINELRQVIADKDHHFNSEFFSFDNGEFLAVIVHASFLHREDIDMDATGNILENISLRILQRFQDGCFDTEHVQSDCNAYLLMNYSDDVHPPYRERRDILQQLLRECGAQYPNFRITFAVSEPVFSALDIGGAFDAAEQASTLRLYAGSARVLEYRKLRAQLPDTPVCDISVNDRQQLEQLVETLRKGDALALARSLWARFQSMESFSVYDLFQVTFNTIMRIRRLVVDRGLRKEENATEQPLPPILTQNYIHICLANCDTVAQLSETLCMYIATEIDHCAELQKQKISTPIRLAQEYIRAHIDRQITLEEAASQAFISPGYLSTLFKEHTGKSFSDYVIEMRMEQAKRLLRQPSLNISEIAQQVGYADARHFSKVFLKIVGVKPTAYRKLYL